MSEIGAGSGTSYPTALDTDNTLEYNVSSASKTRARAEVVNDLADAIVAIETELGTSPSGTAATVKDFLQVQHNTDGSHKAITTNTLTATGQITSNLAIGTKPLVITSTTKCDNLNADLLDDMNSATTNTASTIVARDASGNFAAGTITGDLTGKATNASGTGTAVYSGEFGLRIVRGEVKTVDGGIISGSGFSVVKNSTGLWTITITTPFGGAFTAVVGIGGFGGFSWPGTYTARWLNSSSFDVYGNYDGASADAGSFHFICIGPK